MLGSPGPGSLPQLCARAVQMLLIKDTFLFLIATQKGCCKTSELLPITCPGTGHQRQAHHTHTMVLGPTSSQNHGSCSSVTIRKWWLPSWPKFLEPRYNFHSLASQPEPCTFILTAKHPHSTRIKRTKGARLTALHTLPGKQFGAGSKAPRPVLIASSSLIYKALGQL